MAEKNETAVFGGGCFWCTEAIFQRLRGVKSVTSGYAGGDREKPSYEQVSLGSTGHAEVIKIEFDPSQIGYKDLLEIFFATHDPTTANRQGMDIGNQYRSIILYSSEEQAKAVHEQVEKTEQELGRQVVTEVVPLGEFYKAEDYHQNYYNNNKDKQYCQLVINPKLKKLQEKFADKLST
jgi:peptide-methionine (S)-S-oxide reductase